MIKRPDPDMSDIACQRRAEAAGQRATELEIPKPDHFTKAELALRDALWTYFECLESDFEGGEDQGVIAEMDFTGFRVFIHKSDGRKVLLIDVGW